MDVVLPSSLDVQHSLYVHLSLLNSVKYRLQYGIVGACSSCCFYPVTMYSSEKDTAPIRTGEELDLTRLSAYLSGKIPGVDAGIELEQFPGGHSNLTYLLRASGTEYVLRRAPLGPVPPKAHDMARECKILAAVHPHFAPAPKPMLLCEDP